MGKLSRYTVLVVLAIGCFHLAAGQSYPLKIPQDSSREIRAEDQDYWVLKESQFDSALAHSKRMEILEEQVATLRKQIKIMETKDLEQQALVDTLKYDRNFYKEKWRICEEDLQKLAKMHDDQRRWKKIFKFTTFAGIPLAFLAGLFLL